MCQVVAGLGGVGKTQLAANLAHRYWQRGRIDLLVWVTATSRTAVLTRYAAAATVVTGVEDPDPNEGAERLLAWLASSGRRWLLVLDDLTEPADLQGLWPPITATGRTVVTTRRRDNALLDGRTLIDVGLFSPAEAVAYLRGKLGDRPERLDEAAALADDLGRLPLALAQAAAYIVDQDLTCADYRRRLARRRLHTLRPSMLPDDQRTAVADTWALSIDLADSATDGIATMLLQLAALLDPNGIPVRLFTASAVTQFCAGCLDRPVDADEIHDSLHALHRLGVVAIADAVLRIHQLVQRAVREASTPQGPTRVTTAADALLASWPEVERDSALAHSMRANTIALHAADTDSHLWNTVIGAHPVLLRVGKSLGEAGLVAAAIAYFQELQIEAEQRLDPGHPGILWIRQDQAEWRRIAGDVRGALSILKSILPRQAQIFGPDHSRTLTMRHDLAWCRVELGAYIEAGAEFEALLADRIRVLGPDHRATLWTRSNVAFCRAAGGDPAGAVTDLQVLLDDVVRALGADHPDALNTRNNLGVWQGSAGDPGGAAASFEKLVEDRVRVLGPDNRLTLGSRVQAARWRGEAGDAPGAVAAFGPLLDDVMRALGPEDPETLTARHHLAWFRGEAGDPVGAAIAFEQLLTDRLRVLGPEHPDTLDTCNSLASWQAKAVAAQAVSDESAK